MAPSDPEVEVAPNRPLYVGIVASITECSYFHPSVFDLTYIRVPHHELSPYSSSTASEATLLGDQIQHQTIHQNTVRLQGAFSGSRKRLKADPQISKISDKGKKCTGEKPMATEPVATTAPVETSVAASRPKRVRTGCLTCRERHLKCDEGLPDCVNCRKSNRQCKRGVRLNFIDTQVKTPPITPPTQEYNVSFLDESREIASEYRGGLNRYAALKREPVEAEEVKNEPQFEFSASMIGTPILAHQPLPTSHSLPPGGAEAYTGPTQRTADQVRDINHRHSSSTTESTFSSQTLAQSSHNSYSNSEQTLTPPSESRPSINSPEELLFMQVFVEEVGLWMDSMDPYKHVSHLINTCIFTSNNNEPVLTTFAI